MTTKAGVYYEGINTWRRVISATPQEMRTVVFGNAAREIAGYVQRGFAKVEAVDELTNIALAIGLGDGDEVQQILAEAFAFTLDVVPDLGEGNGRDAGHQASATIYVFPEPFAIPPRQWLYSAHYVRNCATATVAPGGFGKTTLTLFELISMALEGKRVWFISGEDPMEELHRRIAAHCQHHDVDRQRVAQHLYVDDKRTFPLFLGTCPRTSMVRFDDEWIARLEGEIRSKKIDAVALDPFISFHSVPENDNGGIDQIVKRLALIAQSTNACIELSHHVRKPVQGGIGELTVDDTRGGSAIVNAVRSCRVINRMTSDEAGLAKINADKRTSYVRVDKGKRNMAPTEKAQWWHIVSVALPNGDNVQAIESWDYPSVFQELSSDAINWVQKLLQEGGPRRASSQSPDWLGHDLGRHCGRDDTDQKGSAIWANKIIGAWLRNKVIKQMAMRDPVSRKPNVPFYVHNNYQPPDDDVVVQFAKPKIRILGQCEPNTICLACQQADGKVLRIKDATKSGSKSETLHQACAEQWFSSN